MAAFSLEEYEISPECGFLCDLPESLPEYFQPWHDLASNMADYVEKGTMREETLKLVQLDSSRLQSYGDLRLAHLQLSIIALGYAFQNGVQNAAKSLPANIAVPLCDVSDRTGLEPGCSAGSMNSNFFRLDKNRPYTKDNVRLRYPLPGGKSVAAFWAVSTQIEGGSGQLIPIISLILNASKSKNNEGVATALLEIEKWVDNVTAFSQAAFPEAIEPDEFFQYTVPFASGFTDSNGFPEGMLYEGVTDRPRRKTGNVSAAHSASFPIIELIMGLTYPPEQVALKQQWRSTWALPQKRLFEFIEKQPGNVKDMVNQVDKTSQLAVAYNVVLRALSDFRSCHIQWATRYFILPNKKIREALQVTTPDPMEGMIPMLKRFRDDAVPVQEKTT